MFLTVGELIEVLSDYDQDSPVVLSIRSFDDYVGSEHKHAPFSDTAITRTADIDMSAVDVDVLDSDDEDGVYHELDFLPPDPTGGGGDGSHRGRPRKVRAVVLRAL